MLKALPQIVRHKLSYLFGWPVLMPINVTISVTFKCPSRCITCNVTSRRTRDLDTGEYRRLFRSLGRNPFWVTIRGGEPFLRPDLPKIVEIICEESSPAIINIPTSGTTHTHIFKFLPRILESTRGSQFTLNFPLDEIGDKHDQIRRTPENWERTLEAMHFAKSLQPANPHLTIGIHTVISVYNVDRLPFISEELQKLEPDSHITEVAEERAELMTIGSGIAPPPDKYAEVVNFLASRMRARPRKGFASVIDGFRLEYYELVKKILAEKRQVIPCYAGLTSCYIAADGDVWGCCVRAEPIGNLREVDYDFPRIWRSLHARNFRRSVKNKECFCPLANASYTNMMMDPATVSRISWTLFFPGRNRARGQPGHGSSTATDSP